MYSAYGIEALVVRHTFRGHSRTLAHATSTQIERRFASAAFLRWLCLVGLLARIRFPLRAVLDLSQTGHDSGWV